MNMLELVRLSLRVTHNALDEEIIELIESAKMDLFQSGISVEMTNEDSDPLIKRAIILYAKANFGINNDDSEKYQKSYDSLKIHLSLAGDYNE
ncbi:DNA-packaging protein [Arthrobacter citreus]|nr:DNA-packaging protein [Arthrobacter citreus]